MPSEMTRQSLRDRMRDAVREELRETAFAMFLESGYDAVSIEQIAAQAGVSPRTFFRYFPNKEDVLLEWFDHYGPAIYDAVRTAPADMALFDVVRHAMARPAELSLYSQDELKRNRLASELIMTSPRLRAGMAERRRIWETEIGGLLALRMNTAVDEDIGPAVLASLAINCAMVTVSWNIGTRRQDGTVPEATTDDAFLALRKIMTGK
jgi:AcrR family transcriptional regulator